jgi:hypothetical protein
MEAHSTRRPTWLRWLGWCALGLVVAALGVGGWMLYLGVSTSVQAERNLHATIFAIRLVEQFVHDSGRWPGSWDDLEKLRFPSATPSPLNERRIGPDSHEWPGQAARIRECVEIDFHANPVAVADEDAMRFTAIRPIGPYYEYRDYGYVPSLQETIKNSIKSKDQ